MEEEIDLIDLFQAFWKKKVYLLLAIIIGALVGFAYTKFAIKPKYSSSVTLILAKVENSTTSVVGDAITQADVTLNQKLISTYSEIMQSKRVANAVVQKLNLNMSYNSFKNAISVSAVKDTDVIKVSITTSDPNRSKDIATALFDVFADEVDRIYGIKNVSIIDEAEIDTNPVNINYKKNIALFAIIFFIAVAGVIFLFYYFDNTVKTADQIQKLIELPVLATIPKAEKSK